MPPHKMREKSAADLELRQRLLDSIAQAISENLPDDVPSEESMDDDAEHRFKSVLLAFVSPDNPNFPTSMRKYNSTLRTSYVPDRCIHVFTCPCVSNTELPMAQQL